MLINRIERNSPKRGLVRPLAALGLALAIAAVAALGSSWAQARFSRFNPESVGVAVLQGSTTFNSRLVQAHRESVEASAGQHLTVIPNRSGAGLVALLEGRADLAMISTALGPEIKALAAARPELPFARLKSFLIRDYNVAFAVNPSSPLRNVTRAQLSAIVRGDIMNWRQVGGPDLDIVVAYVPGADGVTLSAKAALSSGRPFAANAVAIETHPQLVKFVGLERGAVGLAQLHLAREAGLPRLTLDKPVSQTLSLVSLGDPDPRLRAVIDAFRAAATGRS